MKRSTIFVIIAVIVGLLIGSGYIVYNEIRPCVPDWGCSEWGDCTKSVQARGCVDNNKCNSLEGRPDVVRSCNMKCYDKLHNQDEEDVDCGGVCEPCDVKRAPARKNRIIIYGVLIALCSIFVVMVYRRGKGEASIFKKEITGRVYKFKSKLKNAKQGVQIREANADPRLNQLQGYINWCLAQGYSYQSIKQSLINSGWPEYYIDQAFGNLNNIRIGG